MGRTVLFHITPGLARRFLTRVIQEPYVRPDLVLNDLVAIGLEAIAFGLLESRLRDPGSRA